jgi:hypothetical protein
MAICLLNSFFLPMLASSWQPKAQPKLRLAKKLAGQAWARTKHALRLKTHDFNKVPKYPSFFSWMLQHIKKMVVKAAWQFILAGNADPMGMAGRKSSQYVPLCLKILQRLQSQDNQEHKILPLLLWNHQLHWPEKIFSTLN